MKVAFHPLVIDFLEEQTLALYEKGYVGFYDSACEYVDRMVDDISSNIHIKLCKKAPSHFNKYGKTSLGARPCEEQSDVADSRPPTK